MLSIVLLFNILLSLILCFVFILLALHKDGSALLQPALTPVVSALRQSPRRARSSLGTDENGAKRSSDAAISGAPR